jgi:hypothetical protein
VQVFSGDRADDHTPRAIAASRPFYAARRPRYDVAGAVRVEGTGQPCISLPPGAQGR